MIPFRPIELEDKETVQRYTLTSKRRRFLICIAGGFCTRRKLLKWTAFCCSVFMQIMNWHI